MCINCGHWHSYSCVGDSSKLGYSTYIVTLLLGVVLNNADTPKQGSTSPIAVIYRHLGFTFSTFSWQETLVLVIASKDSW